MREDRSLKAVAQPLGSTSTVLCGLLQGVQTVRTQTVTLSRSLDCLGGQSQHLRRPLGPAASVHVCVCHATATGAG